MITSHDILSINNEEILYIYLDYNYEFAKMGSKDGKNGLVENIYSYMKNKKIRFDGTKVVVIVGTVLLGTVILANPVSASDRFGNSVNKEISHEVAAKISEGKVASKEEKASSNKQATENKNTTNNSAISSTNTNTNSKASTSSSNSSNNKSNTAPVDTSKSNTTNSNTNQTSNTESAPKPPVENKTMVSVSRSNGSVLNIELEEYLIGVVGAEMPASFSSEALKAQAVAARTYTLRAIQMGRKLTDTVSTQAYSDNNQLKALWGSGYDTYYNKIKNAVNDTKGQVVTYNGGLIDAVFHSTSNGHTESAKEVWGNDIAYLQSVNSPWDKDASSYLRSVDKEFNVVSNIFGLTINKDTEIQSINRNTSGRVSSITIDDKTYTGVDIRNLFGLRSTDFDMVFSEDKVTFTTRGYGHGVGMSQYGANGMANNGYSYKQILTHYYKGVSIIQK